MNRQWSLAGLWIAALLIAAAAGGVVYGKGQAAGRAAALAASPLGSAFTYQGQLKRDGNPVDGVACDFQFTLWDAESGGMQKGSDAKPGVEVNDGLFTVSLDFGSAAFNGDERWLEISVQCPDDAVPEDLGRQELTAAPYALHSLSTGALQGQPVSSAAPAAGQVLEWDGGAWAPADSGYDNVIVVAKSGGDFTSIQAALDSIIDPGPANRYLVWVGPGTYSEQVAMRPYVDIEGSGQGITIITSAGSGSAYTGTLLGANDAELRFLTVENYGGNTEARAIYNNSVSPRMTHVEVIAYGGTNNWGIVNDFSSSPMMVDVTAVAQGGNCATGAGNFNGSSPTMINVIATGSGSSENNRGVVNADYYGYPTWPTMTNVVATASGAGTCHGVYNLRASMTMRNSTVVATGGTTNHGIYSDTAGATQCTVLVHNSQITGSDSTVVNDSGNFNTYIGASLLDGGGVSIPSGSVTCAGVYDEAYSFSTGPGCP